MIRENLELNDCVEIINDVERRIKTVGIRGLDFDKAKELGVFERISNILCAIHSTINAAYRIYGDIDYMISELGGKRNEIAKAMNDYEKAFDKFFRFWTYYYNSKESGMDVIEDMESLYHRIMDWADLPEKWELGDEQKKERKNVAIKVSTNDQDVYYFHKNTIEEEILDESKESWCVTMYDRKSHVLKTINTDVDKASALMIAKRLSDDDKENLYVASTVEKQNVNKTIVTPHKVFYKNQTIGKIKGISK